MIRGFGILAVWLVLIALPLSALLIELVTTPSAWGIWGEYERIGTLFRNTLQLILGTELLVIPLGASLGFVLFRTDMPGRSSLRRLFVLSVFVPLPVLASAWQVLFGAGKSHAGIWAPWTGGMMPVVIIHSVALLPWATWLFGHGFSWWSNPPKKTP